MFRGARSLALVGNSDTILEHASGARIDGCDVVVRFNKAYVEGIEDKVGSRTDILVANRTYSLAKAPPAATLRPRCVLSFVEPLHDVDYAAFLEWTGEVPTLVTLAPDLLQSVHVERTRPVTMGTAALYTLLNLFAFERIFLTGFTFYGAAGSGQGVYWKDDRKSRGMFHDLEPEARIFVSILERFAGTIEATPEVESLRARYGSGGRAAAGGSTAGLEARLGWRLIRWGMKLRQRAERTGGRLGSGPGEPAKKR